MEDQKAGPPGARAPRLATLSIGLAAIALVAATAFGMLSRSETAGKRSAEAGPAADSVANAPELMSRHTLLAAQTEGGLSAPVPTEQTPLPSGLMMYRVQEGDNLWDIARRYGSSVEQIAASNGLGSGDLIGPGKDLLVPLVAGFAYHVKEGDTLSGLALRFSISADAIQNANSLEASQALQPAMVLLLPGAKPPSLDRVRTASTSRSLAGGRTSTSWNWPVRGPVTSKFGPRWGSFHEGIDIAVAQGTPVGASRSGRVSLAGWDGGYGKAVIINHGDGTSSLYAHLSEINVNIGESVDQGERIGLSGSTGDSTGPHLHFEVRVGGTQKNPLSYLP
ncbi:MAG: M23 family metallopeptidase [Firmicutes bacterium]|nr:M23 family metallopeptidase [Bacillota bacterium]